MTGIFLGNYWGYLVDEVGAVDGWDEKKGKKALPIRARNRDL